jgi:hypothetical protein
MFAELLYQILVNEPTLQALIGTPGTRSDKTTGIFPTQASVEEPNLPFIAYIQIFGHGESVYEGVDRLVYARYRLACWGSTAKQAKKLANQVRLRLDGIRGSLPGTDAIIRTCLWVTETDTTDDLPHGTMYGTHQDYDFVYEDHSDGH